MLLLDVSLIHFADDKINNWRSLELFISSLFWMKVLNATDDFRVKSAILDKILGTK